MSHFQPQALTLAPADTVLVFTGHMVDLPDRKTPRFPPALEPFAAKAIGEFVSSIKSNRNGTLVGIASGARGGDIIFHEICRDLDIPTIIVLPFGAEGFIKSSVTGANSGNWTERFQQVWDAHEADRRIVLEAGEKTDPFDACNNTMLDMAERIGARVELIALWDGTDIGKPGGRGAFVSDARSKGCHFTHIDIKALWSEFEGRKQPRG